MRKVFVDGSSGTTGLRIRERLAQRKDITLLMLPEEKRKDPAAKKELLNACDAAFLCLPDDAAREAVALAEGTRAVILDTSTAHRTAPGWVYGFPELKNNGSEIAAAKRIAVPGCHASGFIALVFPLVEAGLLPKDSLLTCFSLTGYSGGGKKMIAQYEGGTPDKLLGAPRQYALGQTHKHLPEMQHMTGLTNAPVFCPVVADYYSGMEVTVPLFASCLNGTAEDIRALYRSRYTGPLVQYCEGTAEEGFLSASALAGTDKMEISVEGSQDRILLIARYDNLGKGASGAAVECLNLVLGADPATGLVY